MCGVCGCSDKQGVTIEGEDGTHTHVLPDGTTLVHRHDHGPADGDSTHGHEHTHTHTHAHSTSNEVIELETKILGRNAELAMRNRGYFAGRELLCLNLMSSPGAGKTTLLEATLKGLDLPASVLEGDQETSHDAERIRATGAKALQINTGKGCHLEADMVWRGLQALKPEPKSVLFVENVGNLVCPALFDLGEHARVVLFSVTEGEDKPLKYPHMFHVADLVLITKIDLAEPCEFDRDKALRAIHDVAPQASVLELSAHKGNPQGQGMRAWFDWILKQHAQNRTPA